MSKDKRDLRPWWRRRYWPWACGVGAIAMMFWAIVNGVMMLMGGRRTWDAPTNMAATLMLLWLAAVPSVLLGGASIAGFRQLWRHRHPPGHCQRCGYDMRGLTPGSACPECGNNSTVP